MRIDVAPNDDIVALVRGATSESLVVVILPGRDPLAKTLGEAAIGPLAAERAPARLNAVIANDDPDTIDAVVGFLERATSTTGQVLRLS